MLSQHETRVAHDYKDEVCAHGPERADGNHAANAFGLQHAVAKTRRSGRDGAGDEAGGANRDGFGSGGNALIRGDGNVDV